jgi:hypothetical protein
MNRQSGLIVCGAIAAVAVAVAGCGSSAPSAPGGSAGGSAGGAVAASAKPSWAAALGSGVTIFAPQSASPGNGSPEAVVAGIIAAENSGNYVAACNYDAPDLQSQCKSQLSAAVSASPSALASAVGHATNFGIGYVAVQGDQALVGTTGTFCSSGSCYTNTDPAAIFSSGKSFSAQWTDANDNGSSGSYALAPCTEVNGKWYIYSPPSS